MAEQKAAGKRKSTMKKVWYYERKKFINLANVCQADF